MNSGLFRVSFLLVISLATISPAPAQEIQPLATPPAYVEVENINSKVQQSKLGKDAKAAVAEQFAALKAQFAAVWQPLKEKHDKLRSEWDALKAESANFANAKANLETQRPPANASEGQVNAFNGLVDAHNKRLQEAQNRHERAIEKAKADLIEVGNKFDQWLAGHAVREFVATSQALLDGKVKFRKDLAWRQLAAAADGKRDPVFDNGNTDVVDATNVRPYGLGERDAELRKPRVEVKKRKPAAPPPSPAPPR